MNEGATHSPRGRSHPQPGVLPHLPPPAAPLSPSARSRAPDSSFSCAAPGGTWPDTLRLLGTRLLGKESYPLQGAQPPPRTEWSPRRRPGGRLGESHLVTSGTCLPSLPPSRPERPAQVQAACRTRIDQSLSSAASSAKPGASLQSRALLPRTRGNSPCRSGMLGKTKSDHVGAWCRACHVLRALGPRGCRTGGILATLPPENGELSLGVSDA